MNAAEVYDVWAPPEVPWSAWAKPVVFAALDAGLGANAGGPPVAAWGDASWAPPAAGDTALVLDLDGQESLAAGVALARRGWRPVPLYNGCHGPAALIDVATIARGLVAGIPELVAAALPADAPPAFLLDARREQPAPSPGTFDNRWVVLPQDFPSANLLASRGVRAAVLVQSGRSVPRDDLSHVLRRWQEGGIALRTLDLRAPGPRSEPLEVGPPPRFRSTVHALLVLAGLRRSSAGGFGALIPLPPPPGSGGGHSGGFG